MDPGSPASDRHRWAVEVLDPAPDEHILEVGCGHGVTAARIGERLRSGTGSLTGIDRSATMIAAATRRNASSVHDDRARFVQATLVDAPLEHGRFDAILAFHVADFWNRPAPTLARTAELLTPGGRLVLLNQLPGWNQRAEPEAFADQLVATLTGHGFAVVDRVVTALGPHGLAVVSRPVRAGRDRDGISG